MISAASYFTVGQTASITRIITDRDVDAFACLSGDDQPLHTDEGHASKTRFGARVAHGAMLVGFISAVLGVEMAGRDSTVIFLGMNASFRKPLFIGDSVTTRCEVTKIREDKPIVTLDCRCLNQRGEEVLSGEAVVYVDPHPVGP